MAGSAPWCRGQGRGTRSPTRWPPPRWPPEPTSSRPPATATSRILGHLSPAGARADLGPSGASFDPAAAQLEGFARPLWGLAPLAAGGGAFDHWDRVRQGLAVGVDPGHPEYWGPIGVQDQRLVEAAAIGAGLLLAPDQLWEPLDPASQGRVVTWLSGADHGPLRPNNWLFFRVLIHLGLARVGAGFDQRVEQESLDEIDRLYQGDGWYRDGPQGLYDWYNPFALHTYGLLYAASGLGQADRADAFRRRAREFAHHHQLWFAPGGAGLAFGRSATYRFAQATFWAALAVADLEALDWGVVKGLYLRNLRHWASRPVAGPDGLLTVGYGYDGRQLADPYNSPGSPYWAMKAFLALAAPADHPFWTADEQPVEPTSAPVAQPRPGLVLSRDDEQVLALNGGQRAPAWLRGGVVKYQRLAYSTQFGYSADDLAPGGGPGRSALGGTGDSTLWLADGQGDRRLRGEPLDVEVVGSLVASRWLAWPDVEVDTVLWGQAPWHGRLHRVRSARRLHVVELGFALGLEPGPAGQATDRSEGGPGWAKVRSPLGLSAVFDPHGGRRGEVRTGAPNTNLEWPRTRVPVLIGVVPPGTHDLLTWVLGVGPGRHGGGRPGRRGLGSSPPRSRPCWIAGPRRRSATASWAHGRVAHPVGRARSVLRRAAARRP